MAGRASSRLNIKGQNQLLSTGTRTNGYFGTFAVDKLSSEVKLLLSWQNVRHKRVHEASYGDGVSPPEYWALCSRKALIGLFS